MDAAPIALAIFALLLLATQPVIFLILAHRAAAQLLAKYYEHVATNAATGEPVYLLEKRLDLAKYNAETQRKKLQLQALDRLEEETTSSSPLAAHITDAEQASFFGD